MIAEEFVTKKFNLLANVESFPQLPELKLMDKIAHHTFHYFQHGNAGEEYMVI